MPDNLYFSQSARNLKSSVRGLYGTSTAPLPFLRGVVVHSFLLERPQGNIMIGEKRISQPSVKDRENLEWPAPIWMPS